MIMHDPQEFGGLEEYAVTLAISLKQRGQQVSVLSTTWVPADNQYVKRLLVNGVRYVQVPKWFSRPASHWPTKERIVAGLVWLATPLVFLSAATLLVLKRSSWRQALKSAQGRFRRELWARFVKENRYKPLFLMLLGWWRFFWHPDILHIQGYTTNLLFVIEWADRKKVPVVYEEHQTPDAQFNWWKGFDQSLSKANTVVAVSEKSAQALREVCNVTSPIVVRSPLLPDPARAGWRYREPLQENQGLSVTTVARLVVTKGLTYLLEAIVQVKVAYPSVQFRVYGDGPLRDELMSYAGRLGLDGNAIFVGSFTRREDLSLVMAATDIFVLSSILEGQPLSLVEAMSYGCPIIATSVGGIPEIINDGVNGLLCLPHDPACLAEKIKLLVANPRLRAELGREARRSYELGPFQPDSVSNHFLSIYQNAMKQESSI